MNRKTIQKSRPAEMLGGFFDGGSDSIEALPECGSTGGDGE